MISESIYLNYITSRDDTKCVRLEDNDVYPIWYVALDYSKMSIAACRIF